MEAININDYLTKTSCIGTVENVDTRKVVVSVENARYLSGEESACQCRDMVSIPGSGRSPGK